MYPLVYAQRTDRGRVRERNEDFHAASVGREGALFVVADGLGGMADGDAASRQAVEALLDSWSAAPQRDEAALAVAFERANARVFEQNRARPPLRWMATTLTASLFQRGRLSVAHVGDCRLYRIRQRGAERLTRDHSVSRHELTRVVGTGPDAEPDRYAFETAPGDLYVQCSDGLYGALEEAALVRVAVTGSVEEAARRLVEAANAAGGPDNITVQVVRIPGGPSGEMVY
jgi:protein phosphatase